MKSLEIEEILDLWRIVFPQERDISYDEEQNKFHYQRGKPAMPTD
jgi:hypothetical protein